MEARELAHVAFQPALVSAGIDLLLIYARSHDPGRAEPLLAEVESAVQQASGWHAWKWKMRLSHAVRARARGHLMRQALDDARAAVNVARRLSDPAVLLECLGVLLEHDQDSNVLVEWQQTAESIPGALTNDPLRRVGPRGFEPPASWSRTMNRRIIYNLALSTMLAFPCELLRYPRKALLGQGEWPVDLQGTPDRDWKE
jgi:hypothetical protein